MKAIRRVAFTLLFFLVFASHILFIGKLAGQTGGLITGTVTDASGAAIPDATVSVKSEKTGEVRNVKSDGAGHYSVANLPPTSYAVEANAPALGPTQYSNLQITVGQERVLNIILQPA